MGTYMNKTYTEVTRAVTQVACTKTSSPRTLAVLTIKARWVSTASTHSSAE